MTKSEFDTLPDTPRTFHQMVAADPVLTERHTAICQMVINAAREAHGVELTPSDVSSLPSVRLAVIGQEGLGDSGFLEREIAMLPATQAAIKERELAGKVKAGDDAAHAELAKLSPSARIAWARKHGIADGKPQDAESIDDEATKHRMVMAVENRSARLALARKFGIA